MINVNDVAAGTRLFCDDGHGDRFATVTGHGKNKYAGSFLTMEYEETGHEDTVFNNIREHGVDKGIGVYIAI